MKRLYTIIPSVSPSIFGGETKNQDRALFNPATNTASICDGTTSSPYAEQAAKIVCQSASILIDDVDKNLKTVSDLLLGHRNTVIKTGVIIDNSIPASMREQVQEAARENLKQSFQTTVVAVGFEKQLSCISVRVLSCGDSGFFALSEIGELLLTNLTTIQNHPSHKHRLSRPAIPFYPGSEFLVKISGTLSEYPKLIKKADLRNPDKWYLCRAVSSCGRAKTSGEPFVSSGMNIESNELLVVPKYLVPFPKDPEYAEFRRVRYSQNIHRLVSPGITNSDMQFDIQSNITAVLPDHYYTGQWDFFEERFATDTHFLLCSDGFYRAFSDTSQMWLWLKKNENALLNRKCKQQLLEDLHRRLNKTCGDDDISFVWLTPKKRKEG